MLKQRIGELDIYGDSPRGVTIRELYGDRPCDFMCCGGGGVATAAAGGLPAGARIVCQKNLPTVIYLKV